MEKSPARRDAKQGSTAIRKLTIRLYLLGAPVRRLSIFLCLGWLNCGLFRWPSLKGNLSICKVSTVHMIGWTIVNWMLSIRRFTSYVRSFGLKP